MSETREINFKRTSTQRKGRKKKISKSGIILLITSIIILIPCLVFVGILGISALQTSTPRNGDRFKGDLVSTISEEQANSLQASLSSISNVESVKAKVSEGQFKIYIDTIDSIDEETFDKVINDAYELTISKFPIATYFTKTDSTRMYDLQINVYTTATASENRQYKLLHKNSAEENYMIDDLAHPKDSKLADELEGKTNVSTDDGAEVSDDAENVTEE